MGFFRTTARLDAELAINKTATRMHFCSAEPTTYAAAVSLSGGFYDLDSGDFGANEANPGAGGGRRFQVGAQSGNNATATLTANHVALVNVAGTELLDVIPIADLSLVSGEAFTSSAFYCVAPLPEAFV